MRISVLSVGLLAFLTPLAGAWSKEDREIFRVRDELIAHEGPDVTFYEFLGVAKAASQDDISKAYKKKSRELHPDKVKSRLTAERVRLQKEKAKEEKKNGGNGKSSIVVTKPPTASELKAAIKRAGDRQARLHLVTEVLRGAGRDRYDFFLANGFPTWKGTEYYYSRYRPGLGTVMFGVFLFAGGGVHYLALYMSWKKQREFVERYIKFARHAAWGENLGINVPGLEGETASVPVAAPQQQMMEDAEGRVMPMNRKMKRMQERDSKKERSKEEKGSGGRRGRRAGGGKDKESGSGSATPLPPAPEGAGPTGAKKRVVAENGKVLVVDSLGDVYLEQEDEDGNTAEYLLDLDQLSAPTIKDTAIVRLPVWAFNRTLGRFVSKSSSDEYTQAGQDEDEEDVAGAVTDDNSSEPGKDTPSTGSAEDFELLEKSVDELGQAKTTSAQKQGGGKAGKRKNKKR